MDVEMSRTHGKQFDHSFIQLLDGIAPYRDIKKRQQTEPWMTSDILDNRCSCSYTLYSIIYV